MWLGTQRFGGCADRTTLRFRSAGIRTSSIPSMQSLETSLLVVQIKQMVPVLPSSSPPRRGATATSSVTDAPEIPAFAGMTARQGRLVSIVRAVPLGTVLLIILILLLIGALPRWGYSLLAGNRPIPFLLRTIACRHPRLSRRWLAENAGTLVCPHEGCRKRPIRPAAPSVCPRAR